jgi:hypothetical protein
MAAEERAHMKEQEKTAKKRKGELYYEKEYISKTSLFSACLPYDYTYGSSMWRRLRQR